MKATRWVTLIEFVKYLGRPGIARVDETEKGWFLAWVGNSPKTLAEQVRQVIYFIAVLKRRLTVEFVGSRSEGRTFDDVE